MEIDFLIVRPYASASGKPCVSPVEVKSPKQYGTISLDIIYLSTCPTVPKRCEWISQIVPMRALVVVEAIEGDLLGKLAHLRLKLAYGAAGVIAFQEQNGDEE